MESEYTLRFWKDIEIEFRDVHKSQLSSHTSITNELYFYPKFLVLHFHFQLTFFCQFCLTLFVNIPAVTDDLCIVKFYGEGVD